MQATSDPIWMRSVALARPAMVVKHSQTPRSSSSAGTWNWLSGWARNTRWSMIQTASKPASSAVRVIARMSAKWGVPPNAESSAIGRMTPMPIGRVLAGQRLSVVGCHRAGSVPSPRCVIDFPHTTPRPHRSRRAASAGDRRNPRNSGAPVARGSVAQLGGSYSGITPGSGRFRARSVVGRAKRRRAGQEPTR